MFSACSALRRIRGPSRHFIDHRESELQQVVSAEDFGTVNISGGSGILYRAKYLLFGATAAVFGALIGIGGGLAIERLVCNALETMFVFGNPAHKNEILKLEQKLQVKGYTILPLEVYFKGGRVKIEIGLGKGKKLYDKRETIAKKDATREAEREFKVRMR